MSDQITEAELSLALENLQSGETLLVQLLKTSNPSKVQLEFAEKMTDLEGSSSALLGMLNASDKRFSSGARRAWMTAGVTEVGRHLDINAGDDNPGWVVNKAGKTVLPLAISNPKINDGMRLRVQIQETTEGREYQIENLETSAKRKGAEGVFITHKGDHIFSNTIVVPMRGDNAPVHTILESDAVSTTVAKTEASPVMDETGL